LRNVLVYCFFCPVCASVMRGRYRCRHHLRDRRKLFPPQDQIPSRTHTTVESVGFWNSVYVPVSDQYLLVLQILENSGRYWDTSIYQYLYQYCRYWKILVKYWYYKYCVQYW
jgi:hypothetical protein